MKKIISINEAAQISNNLKLDNKSIILVGGCFDILHSGHIKFLKDAKEKADILFLLLESDKNIKKFKGNSRPINNQKKRAIVLSALSYVDYVILLRGMTKNEEYDKLIVQIKPNYIALTKGDKNIKQREEQCSMINAKLIEIDQLEGFSSSNYINKN